MGVEMSMGYRLVLVGGNEEAVVATRGIHDMGANVVGHVVPAGSLAARTADLDIDGVISLCERHDVKSHETRDINSSETLEWLSSLQPDYIFVLAWSQIFRQSLLDLPCGGIVGSHPTRLPKGRGRAPVSWTIIEGEELTGVSLFFMDLGVDTGDIVWASEFPVEPRSHSRELYDRLKIDLSRGFREVAKQLAEGRPLDRTAQDDRKATYRYARRPEDGMLDFNGRAVDLDRLVRASGDPYGGAFAKYSDACVHFHRAFLPTQDDLRHRGVIGQVLRSDERGIIVQVADGLIGLASPFDHDERRLSSLNFAVGRKLSSGACYG